MALQCAKETTNYPLYIQWQKEWAFDFGYGFICKCTVFTLNLILAIYHKENKFISYIVSISSLHILIIFHDLTKGLLTSFSSPVTSTLCLETFLRLLSTSSSSNFFRFIEREELRRGVPRPCREIGFGEFVLLPADTKRTYKREAELFSLSITNPKGCRWRHLIGSLARPNGTCFRVEHSRITSKISSRWTR